MWPAVSLTGGWDRARRPKGSAPWAFSRPGGLARREAEAWPKVRLTGGGERARWPKASAPWALFTPRGPIRERGSKKASNGTNGGRGRGLVTQGSGGAKRIGGTKKGGFWRSCGTHSRVRPPSEKKGGKGHDDPRGACPGPCSRTGGLARWEARGRQERAPTGAGGGAWRPKGVGGKKGRKEGLKGKGKGTTTQREGALGLIQAQGA